MQTRPISANDSLVLQISMKDMPQEAQTAMVQALSTGMANDSVNITEPKAKKEKEPKEKVPLRQRFLNFVATIKKMGVNVKEFGGGFFKGIAKSAVGTVATVGALFTGNQVIKAIKNNEGFGKTVGGVFKNLVECTQANFTKEGFKATLKSGKGKGAIAIAVLVGAGLMIKTMYDATLKANQQKHDIDERYQKTPANINKK